MVLLAVTAVPLLAFAASHSQQHLYRASASVLVNEQNPATAEALSLAAIPSSPPDRYAATQAKLARLPSVAAMAVQARGVPRRTAAGLLANSSVSSDPTNDLLTFSVTDPNPKVAALLANAYANAFTAYRRRLDSEVVSAALRDTQRRLDASAAAGGNGSPLFRQLQAMQRNLEDLQTLQSAASGARFVGPAGNASLEQPKTERNVVLGVIVGLALGIVLAFLREALDTRVRSADELRTRLGVPLLGQVPRPGRREGAKGLATLWDSSGSSAEAYRILKNNLETSQLEHHADSIAITSTGDDDCTTEIAANLAVVLARSGGRVILVDLDLRRAGLAQLFGLPARPAFTGVASGVMLLDALTAVDIQLDRPRPDAGTLEVWTLGRRLRDPGEFLQSSVLADALELLKDRCELLLLATPPLLAAGDAMAVARHVDALMLVADVRTVRRETLAEVQLVLQRCPTFTLGVVAAGGNAEGYALPLRRNGHEQEEPSRTTSPGTYITDASRKLVAALSGASQARRGRPDSNGVGDGLGHTREGPQRAPDA
jgi:capsular polysaccharide biosynthesis protein